MRSPTAARVPGIVGLGFVAALIGALPASAQMPPFATVTTLASSRNPADAGQTVAFTVRVQSNGLNPIGPIDLSDQGGTVASGFVPPTGIAGSVVAAGRDHSCAVTSSGGAMCWGYNGNGALGTGGNTSSLVPVAVSGLSSGVSSIVATEGATCALTTAGGVRCWGGGYVGGNSNSPADMSGLTSGVAAIAGRGSHACVLTTAGGVKCWGYNSDGQLGNGSTTDSTSPVDVQGLTSGVVAIVTGDYHSCAVTDAGAVKCWGRNTNGQLGNGSYTLSTTPVDVSGMSSGYKWVSAGSGHSCALSETGAVKCWGLNSAGQLGTGSTSPSTVSTPVDVSGLSSGVEALVSGANHSCVLEPTNKMMCWGRNDSAQLGDGTRTMRSSPTAVPSFDQSTLSAIVAGSYHTCAELYDGTMKCWGNNNSGQKGDGTITAFMAQQSTEIGTVSNLTAMTEGRIVLPVSNLSSGVRDIVASFPEMQGMFFGSRSSTLVQTIVGAVNATTTTTIATSNASAVFGETVTFTATVVASSGIASGTVDFIVDDDDPVSVALDQDGKATLQVSTLAVGSHTIGASYGGDTGFDRSKSSPLTQDVARAETTTSAGAKPSTVASGTQITLGAGVRATSPGSGTPTGTVTFYEGSSVRGSLALDQNGGGTVNIAPLAVGTHTLHAAYGGDTDFAASRSSTFTVTVTGGVAESTTTLVADEAKILPGGAVKFTATVGAAEGTSSPTGSVVFKDGATVLGTVRLAAGKASLTTRALTTGSHTIVASYQGSSQFSASASKGARVAVDPRVGPEFRVNTRAAGSQINPSVAAQKSGGFVATWASSDQDGSSWGIYGQRYERDGSRKGGEFRVNSTTEDAQSDPAVVATQDGGFTVVWVGRETTSSDPGYGLWAQRWSAAGGKVGGEFRIDAASSIRLSAPALTARAAGGFATAWTARRPRASGFEVFARLYDEDGAAKTAEIAIGSAPSVDFTRSPAITPIKAGFVVIWAHSAKVGANPVIKGQRLSASGSKLGAEFTVTSASFAQSDPVVAPTADGGFVVAWVSDEQDGSGKGVFAQRFTAGGARIGAAFRVNTTTRSDQTEPVIATGSDGRFIVVWTSAGQDGSKRGVFARRFDAAATPLDVEFRINTEVEDAQYQPSVASRSATDFVVTWTSMAQDGAEAGVYGQRFSVAP